MAVKIRSTQLSLADNFTFAGQIEVPTPSSANQAATKGYVDSQIADPFSGGDGIAIDASGDPDVISVDLATNAGLQFSSNKLDVKVKSETGGSLTKDADGLYIGDGAISNAKLANSTISGKALGANLDALAAGQGLALASPYNGSAGQTIDLNLDGTTLAKSASGVKVNDAGVGTTQLANDAVTIAKVGFAFAQEAFDGNGSATTFDLSKAIHDADGALVMINGQMQERVSSSPQAGAYSVSLTGGAGSVTRITIGGSARDSNDRIQVIYLD